IERLARVSVEISRNYRGKRCMEVGHDLAKLDELRFANFGIVDPRILWLKMRVDGADALFAALELDSKNALAAESIALPDFPYRRAGGEGVKLRRCAH